MDDDVMGWIGSSQAGPIDVDAKRVTLTSRSPELHLGQVPAGWAVTVLFPSHVRSNRHMTVEGIGDGVEWIFAGDHRSTVLLPEAIERLTIDPGGSSRPVGVSLGRSGCTVTVRAGSATVDGPGYTFGLETDLANEQESVHVQGTASLTSAKLGLGTVTLDTPLDQCRRIEGAARNLTIAADVTDAVIDVPAARLEVSGSILAGSEVTTRELYAHHIENSTVDADRAICAEGPITGSTLTVNNGPPDPAALWISGPHQNRPSGIPTELDTRVSHASAYDTSVRTAEAPPETDVVDSKLRCTGGDIAIAGNLKRSQVHAAGSLLVTGTADLTPAANDTLVVEVGGSAVICGATTLSDGAQISAGGALALASAAGSGSIRATDLSISNGTSGISATADTAVIQGHMRDGSLTAAQYLVLRGTVDEAAAVTLNGEGHITAKVAGTLGWQPSTRSALYVSSTCRAVAATGAGNGAGSIVYCDDSGDPLEALTVEGQIDIQLELAIEPERSGPIWVNDLDLGNDSNLTIRAGSRAEIASITCGSRSGLTVDRNASARIVTISGGDLDAHLTADTALTLAADDTADPEAPPAATVTGGGTVEVARILRSLHCVPEAPGGNDDCPLLNVTEDGQVLCLTGDARLGVVAGIVAGRHGKRKSWWKPRSGPTADSAAPKIRGLEPVGTEDQAGSSLSGMVTAVDPTLIPYGQLDSASEYQVFEPDTVSMISYRPSKRKDSDHWHIARRAAYQTQRIADLVAASSASGGARTAAAWAAARAHHDALQNAAVERCLRVAHRALGYSQRPGPPLVTYLVVLATWTALHARYYVSPKGKHSNGVLWTAWKVGQLPASFLARLPDGESAGFPPVLGSYSANVIAFVTLGLPLVFAFIALRHFMAPPRRK